MVLNLRTVSIFVIIVPFAFFAASEARRFYVGGNGGWVTNPPENYNTWAERSRFRVNDTLYFKYPKGSDSVLQVSNADYDSCNSSNPIKKMEDGDSEFVFDRSGPFYFISGNEDHCKKGQRLHVVVLAVRPPNPPTAQPPHAAAPSKSPPMAQPPHAAAPVKSPPSPKSPSPVSPSPSGSPAKSPVTPPPSPSPVSHSPSVSPIPSPAKAPSTLPSSPSLTPSASPKKSPSPAATPPGHSPELPPKSSPPLTPLAPPPGSTTAPTSESPISPGDITVPPAPSRKKSSGSVLAVTWVTTALSVALTVLMSV